MDSRGIPTPHDEAGIRRTMAGYRAALATLTIPQLMDRLTTINAAIEAENQARLATLISTTSSNSPDLDAPVLRSTPRATPSSAPPRATDRGVGPSLSFPPPGPLDLLSRAGRLGPRLTARLIAADLRRRGNAP